MKIVLDANVVIAALMGSRATLTILTSQNHQFYVPQYIMGEIYKHKQFIGQMIKILLHKTSLQQ